MAETNKNSLPFDKLPYDWQDSNKLDNFYSPVRNRQVNPLDWGSKFEFWSSSIEIYCNCNKLYSFSYTQLHKAFLHKSRTPSCLKEIFEELANRGDIIPLSNFLSRTKPEETWSGWLTNSLIKKPLSWTFNKVKTTIVPFDVTNIEYVHIKLVKQEAMELFKDIPEDLKDKVIDCDQFLTLMKRTDKIENLKVLLHYLETEGKVFIKDIKQNNGKNLILLKFVTDFRHTKAISDIDIDIYLLTVKEQSLQKDIEQLEYSIDSLQKLAKEHVKNKHRQLALTILRKKKLIEKSIEKRAKNVLNISTLLHNLQDAAHNQEVLATYKNAINTFKSSYLADLNIDNVDETMASLAEQIDINNDIQTSLSQSFDGNDEDELEAELAQLLAESEDTSDRNTSISTSNIDNITEALNDLNLPNVPENPTKEETANPVLH